MLFQCEHTFQLLLFINCSGLVLDVTSKIDAKCTKNVNHFNAVEISLNGTEGGEIKTAQEKIGGGLVLCCLFCVCVCVFSYVLLHKKHSLSKIPDYPDP